MTGSIARIDALRIAIDGTPLLGHRTGVGEVTAGIVHTLSERTDVALTAYALTWRGRHALAEVLPAAVAARTRPVPARFVRALWSRGVDRPKVESWTGAVDVVHATNFVAPPAKVPVVVTVHDLTFLRFPELCTPDTLRYPGLIARAIARGATIHTPSEFIAAEVRDHFTVPADRVAAIHSGIPPVDRGDAGAGARLAGGGRYVLALGTIEPRKNLATLVGAFDRVAATDPSLRLVLAGPPGWDSDNVHAAIRGAGARDRIVMPGFVSSTDRANLLAGATVFAYPSLYEGFGFPPLEAMRCGVPVIAGAAGSLPEVLGDAARFVEPRDRDALADAISELVDPDSGPARQEWVARGAARVTRFSWSTTGTRLLELYRRLR